MSLKVFFEPKSVAVIGASTSPGKLGYAVLKNLVEGGYAHVGKIYPMQVQMYCRRKKLQLKQD